MVSGQQASAVFSARPRTRLPGSGFPTCAILFSTVRRKLIVNQRARFRVRSPNARIRVRERLEGDNFSQVLNHHTQSSGVCSKRKERKSGEGTATRFSSTIRYKVFVIAPPRSPVSRAKNGPPDHAQPARMPRQGMHLEQLPPRLQRCSTRTA